MLSYYPKSVPIQRRGSLLPVVAIALIVAGGGIALVLDQLWLSTAQNEIQTAANAAALAAAQKLADEETLKSEFDPEAWANVVRKRAADVAGRNIAVGKPAFVSTESGKDIRLGRAIINDLTGQITYLETDHFPTSVIITTHRDRASGNPVSLFMPYLTAQPYGDVIGSAEASISNFIQAVRPLDHANVPAWPIAILQADGGELDDWITAIEAVQGADEYGWDEENKVVTEQPDGLPEMLLRAGTDELMSNVQIVDLGTGLFDSALESQFVNGLHWEHLQAYGSELSFENGPLPLSASTDFSGVPDQQLKLQIGQKRIVLLYQRTAETSANDQNGILATRLVAIRLLAIEQNGEEFELTVQPTVITTRTAVLSEAGDLAVPNPYIYRIALTQ